MASDDVVSGYAVGLLEVLKAEGGLERTEKELYQFGKALETNHKLKQALSDQALPQEQRAKLLHDVIGKQVSEATIGALNFVVSQGRGRQLPQIIEKLTELAAAARASVVAEVRSAIELDDDQRKRLTDALSKATGKKVEVKVIVDPSVIGGVVTKVGDIVIDGSIRRRLEDLKEQVMV